ncbi:hypothetical protein NRO16_003876 [Salmonella enterica]|nr:hypothetical protein [Salmonella enterica]
MQMNFYLFIFVVFPTKFFRDMKKGDICQTDIHTLSPPGERKLNPCAGITEGEPSLQLCATLHYTADIKQCPGQHPFISPQEASYPVFFFCFRTYL